MAGINPILGNNPNSGLDVGRSRTDAIVDAFGKVMLDSYEKLTAGDYTESDRIKMRNMYEDSAEKVDDPAHFRGYFGTLCKGIGLI